MTIVEGVGPMAFFEHDFSPPAWFAAGAVCAFLAVGLWKLLRFWNDLRLTKRASAELARHASDPRADAAWERVRSCRRRLRYNLTPNPEWVAPLVEEVPRLVREIAEIYYPDHPDPMQAPRVSEFARAVQYAAMDIAEILQSQRMGRLIDLSANQPVRAWQKGRQILKHPKIAKARSYLSKLEPVYKAGRPVWQVIRYKSPITWVSLAASNAAIRTVQPVIINIISRRAIDLYSGSLSGADSPARTAATTPQSGEAQAAGPEASAEQAKTPGKLRRLAGKLRIRRAKKEKTP